MKFKDRAFLFVKWASNRAVHDISKVQIFVATIGAKVLGMVDDDRLQYEVAVMEQEAELHELKLLNGTLMVKRAAERSGGFDESHGPALALAANTLYDTFGWEDEDISAWFGALVLNDAGENMGCDIELEDDE